MIDLLASVLVMAGVAVLMTALIPVRQLMRKLPRGRIAEKWRLLAGLIILFVLAYIVYGVAFWGRHAAWSDVIVPGVFLFGAIFVQVVSRLSLRTAIDLRRVALLERENITDALTGIYNRRYLDRRLGEEFSRARRHRHPLSLLMLDIDHFKRINDSYGHRAGDEVLKHLGELLMKAVREMDVVARYGGEELMVIAPDAGLDAAVALAERLRQHAESHELVLTNQASGRQLIRVTISVGVASFHAGMNSVEELVRMADEALYRAKETGRNRVVAHRESGAGSAAPGGKGGDSPAPVSTRELARAREVAARLLGELCLDAYLFEVELRDGRWAIAVECATDEGWESVGLTAERSLLLDGCDDARARAALLGGWREALGGCRPKR